MSQYAPPAPLCHVNPLMGSDSHVNYSNGNTYPAITRPWGMTAWTILNAEDPWFFEYHSNRFRGIRATHQPSPWLRDYGHFLVTPLVGRWCDHPQHVVYPYDIDQQDIHPHVMGINLPSIKTTMELLPTERCSMMRLTLPTDEQSGVRLQTYPGQTTFQFDSAKNRLIGKTTANNGAVPKNFALYFVIESDCPIQNILSMDTTGQLTAITEPIEGEALTAVLRFTDHDQASIHLRFATSFISEEQALRNMDRELGDRDFDTLVKQSADAWNQLLSRIEIQSDDVTRTQTFYTCLYRCLLFPRKFYELDAQDQPQHYSPYDGEIHPGIMHTDNGFWDTYRTLYPLLTVLCPEILGQMLQGWLYAYKQGGWLPKWACPGHLYCMIATHAASVLADAAVKGIGGFDQQLALEAMLKDATVIPGDSGEDGLGRRGLAEYLKLGYVASDKSSHSVARTLDFAYNDYCIAELASYLGQDDLAKQYHQQAKNYRHVYDTSVDFMRAKNSDGSWVEPFDEFAWSRDYIEGGPWQSSWMVPHDPQGLIELMGGHAKAAAKLEQMMTMEPVFHESDYKREIHEMTEMAMADFGQYAQSNQPVHHVLSFFTEAGQPQRTHHWVHKVLTEMYQPTADGFPGDEDNGEMSAWYVLNALGFFPLCPGKPEYHLVAPLFEKAVIHLENGNDWIIQRKQNMQSNTVTINDQAHDDWKIKHQTIVEGGTIQFQ